MEWKKLSKCAAIGGIAMLCVNASADTFIVELDGPSFVYGGLTDMDIDLTIETGDTVRWEWISGFHNVVSGFPGEPGEGTLFNSGSPTGDAGTFFEYTFLDNGTYGYHCEVHETIGMISSVTVIPAPASLIAMSPLGLAMCRRRR
jgi:plastocyanin